MMRCDVWRWRLDGAKPDPDCLSATHELTDTVEVNDLAAISFCKGDVVVLESGSVLLCDSIGFKYITGPKEKSDG
jgi:nanoRNase/pAp phosphatase (c-di-AMP/oligoRNAs hydrolase)